MKMIKTLLICSIYLVTTLSGMTIIKSGQKLEPLFKIPFLDVGLSAMSLVGVFLYGISFIVFVFFVSSLEISIAIPVISGLYCALTVAVGRYLFNESINAIQVAGISFIIVGTVIVGIATRS